MDFCLKATESYLKVKSSFSSSTARHIWSKTNAKGIAQKTLKKHHQKAQERQNLHSQGDLPERHHKDNC